MSQYAFRLRPGDTAVLYSDGLVENRQRDLEAGLKELVTVATQASAEAVGPPAMLVDYLVSRMFTEHKQDDDVTILVVHRVAELIPAAQSANKGQIRDTESAVLDDVIE